jgi:uncharacterized phage-associated protein
MSADELELSVLPSVKPESVSMSGADASPDGLTISGPASTKSAEVLVDPLGNSITQSTPDKNTPNVSVHDVAAFILQQRGEMTAMKLQKLVYYSQAWSLVWDESPLFDEPIEAWANGPVVRALYMRHQGDFMIKRWVGDPDKLTDNQRDTIEKVLEFYGEMSSQALSNLTHQEAPWAEARMGLSPTDRSSRTITHAAMVEYYSSLK